MSERCSSCGASLHHKGGEKKMPPLKESGSEAKWISVPSELVPEIVKLVAEFRSEARNCR